MKIIPRIFGGLGNQLFIYAAMRRLALVNNAELVLDVVSGFDYDHQYQRRYQLDKFHVHGRKASPTERLEPFSKARRYLKRRWNQRLIFERRSYLVQEGIDFEPRLLAYKPKGALYTEGYWQSEGYFKDIEGTIRDDLRIMPPIDYSNRKMMATIKQRLAVAVHVRFFDEPAQVGSVEATANNVTNGYYQRAITEMEQRVQGAHYFLFSDHPEIARKRIPLPDERITLVDHNKGDAMAYADLWLMTHCQHFIIANSTFSWWGAWLATHQNKIVIAPGFEKRHGVMSWGFEGLLPDEWIKL